MTCRSCGAEIADKAIVCYRCGTPTALPESPRPAPKRRQSIWVSLPAMLVILLLGAWLIPKTTPGTPERIAAWVITWLVAFGVVAWLRQR